MRLRMTVALAALLASTAVANAGDPCIWHRLAVVRSGDGSENADPARWREWEQANRARWEGHGLALADCVAAAERARKELGVKK